MLLSRDLCADFAIASRREWLVTNGLGSYAAGTVSDVLTRRYHGLFVPALDPPVGRRLLWTKADARAACGGITRDLGANLWHDGTIAPRGFVELESFRLDGTTPVWRFAFAGVAIERRVFYRPDGDECFVRYAVLSAPAPVDLDVRIYVNDRDYHGITRAYPVSGATALDGNRARVQLGGGTPWYLTSCGGTLEAAGEWYYGFLLPIEAERGLESVEDHYYALTVRARLQPGESVTLSAALTEAATAPAAALEQRMRHEAAVGARRTRVLRDPRLERHARRLTLAADQFIVRRQTAAAPDGRSIIAGYPWFADWGRDAMIASAGLMLCTGRFDDARQLLRTFAHFIDGGMLPNRFPDAGGKPEYNTVDAALWFAVAVARFVDASHDAAFGAEMLPMLRQIVQCYTRGTRFGIHADADGLLTAGEAGVQLTWMDAKVGDWVVTPRAGKAIEINALWYNALRITAAYEREHGFDPSATDAMCARVASSFDRFWNAAESYTFDVIDGPTGTDASVRPNALFACALQHQLLEPQQRRAVVDRATRELLTPAGMRSLSCADPAYRGNYCGDQGNRDAAYHEGTVWPWLIGAYVAAHLSVYGDPEAALAALMPCLDLVHAGAVGTIPEIADGDAPHAVRGCFAQAWSVGEALRALDEIAAAAAEPPVPAEQRLPRSSG